MFIRHQGVVIQIISLHINEKAFMKTELHFKEILSRFIWLINKTLKWLPFNLVMAPVVFFILLLIVSSLILFMTGNSQICQKKCFLFGYI